MDIRKLSGAVGAELTGLDLNALTDAGFSDLKAALFAHGMVVVRRQSLTPEAHIALAERFGKIDTNRFFTPVATHPMIAEVRTSPEMTRVIGGTWHTDHSYDPAPAMCSILAARELPPYGGDTLFASMTAAYEGLSEGLKSTLRSLSAVHSDGSFAQSRVGIEADASAHRAPALHPCVIAHPETGAPCLYVNGDFTENFVGWSAEESAPLLSYLYAHATRPEYSCRLRWEEGSVAIWDNRLVQHFASADYAGHGRLMHRITVEGVALEGFN
ncbi:TauD/TfdA dioxygenase family protein [Planktotalea sp.]|uniref:TauD/TfdA dioxygenase family protein n=1 Tax=Planktotalea sp. TaxID=2029877 RepID=UPI003D6AA571